MTRTSRYFIKFDPRTNKLTGCQKATLILGSLEYWFAKKPDGFYKFIEPCSHHLYKKGDSWAEELGFERRRFSRSFKKIGVKYNSRMAFEQAEDKFQGKMYASYYDRYSNKTFFLRNHDLANELLKDFSSTKTRTTPKGKKAALSSVPLPNPLISVPDLPMGTVHNGLSYMEAKNTTGDLSKDKSHAGSDIAQKMVEIWTAIVEGGKNRLDLTGKRIAFLKKAFADKFDSCLEKWKQYCENVASSRFLMGEIKPFRATLDWVLKFDIIQKILDGNYGIGDRNPNPVPSRTELEINGYKAAIEAEHKAIDGLAEEETIKAFRRQWLKLFGARNYAEQVKNCPIELTGQNTLTLRPLERYTARSIASYWNPSVFPERSPFTRVNILHAEGDCRFDKWFVSGFLPEDAEGGAVHEKPDALACPASSPRQDETFEGQPKSEFLPPVPEPILTRNVSEGAVSVEKHEPTEYKEHMNNPAASSGEFNPKRLNEHAPKSTEEEPQEFKESKEIHEVPASIKRTDPETGQPMNPLNQTTPEPFLCLDGTDAGFFKPDGALSSGLGNTLRVEESQSRFVQDPFQGSTKIFRDVHSLAEKENGQGQLSDCSHEPLEIQPVTSSSALSPSSQGRKIPSGTFLNPGGYSRLEKALASFMSACSPSVAPFSPLEGKALAGRRQQPSCC